MTNALAVPDQAIINVTHLANVVRALYSSVFKEGVDYGVIPGTGNKPTLLLPGMEKLMRAMNAVPVYREVCVIRDYDRPLFHYEYECTLVDADTGAPIPGGRGIGLATSMESGWRWRDAKRKCPTCGEASIIEGRPEYGGGWICFTKKGGCGAKFKTDDARIADQQLGRIENPDIFDQINAIAKRGQKRSMSSAVKGAANVSELFTVDLDDLATYPTYARQPDSDTGEIITVSAEAITTSKPPEPAPAQPPPPDNPFAGLPEIEPPPPIVKKGFTQVGINSLLRESERAGLSEAQLLAALGIDAFSEYAGTFADARAMMRKAANAVRDAAAKAGPEKEVVF